MRLHDRRSVRCTLRDELYEGTQVSGVIAGGHLWRSWRPMRLSRHPLVRQGMARAAASSALVLLLAGCGFASGAAKQDAPVLLAQAGGICPLKVVYNTTLPTECVYDRSWNGATHVFSTPRRLWGVAYAFNCGARARDFSFVARLPGMDHMALPGAETHARRGSGYVMFSRQRMLDFLAGVPPEYSFDGKQMTIDLATPCTWHVKAILGSRSDVSAAVPAVPAVQRRWWK